MGDHRFAFGGVTYQWRLTQGDQIQLWGRWMDGWKECSACLLLLTTQELRLLLETGALVLQEATDKQTSPPIRERPVGRSPDKEASSSAEEGGQANTADQGG